MNKKNYYKIVLAFILVSIVGFYGFKQSGEQKNTSWLQITAVESVVPAGIGRSRMISIDENGKMEEIKMKNFFSIAGINFSNIRANDLKITTKIQELTNEGWVLDDVTSGVFSGNENNSNGIFITRYLFKKEN
ncbi:MAG TPA: hypothetical protein QF480_01235 [Bacteroidales bacterium]|jgi:hypothetical protein|nr:hypothetical protein [Bacteroidales bacterium]|tara:strand:- start:3922 stop:4320 length:399 start_codon:yes stop_codon:yes gene_type:complete